MSVRVLAMAICAAGAAFSLFACNRQASAPASPQSSQTASKTIEEPKLTLGQGDRLLTIRSDQDQVAISGVFLDGLPMKTEGLGTPTVRALLVAEPEEGFGTPCESDGFEVRLANGVSFRPLTNFCNSKYVMTVPAAKAALPDPLPVADAELSWNLDGRGADKMLYFGIPETDATMFLATCRKASGRIQAKFFGATGNRPQVDLYAPDRVLRYDLRQTSSGSSEEDPIVEVELGLTDQLWSQLRGGAKLAMRMDHGEFRMLDASRGAKQIAEFLGHCDSR